MKPRHLSKIEALRQQAAAQLSAGSHMKALSISQRARELALQRGGPDHPVTAECFMFHAEVLAVMGDLNAAESNYNAAYGMLDATAGEATELKARVLFEYGCLYARMGLGWRSLLLLDWAKRRYEELSGPDHEDVGRCWSMIATVQENLSADDAAVAYDEAIRILSREWGSGHPSVNYLIVSRADLACWEALKARDPQEVADAIAQMRAAVSRLEEGAGTTRRVYTAKGMLGALLIENGSYEEGADLLQQACVVQQETEGRMDAGYLRMLARSYAATGHAASALAIFRRANADMRLEHVIAHGSEGDRTAALERAYFLLEQFLELVVVNGAANPEVVAEACDLVLEHKALGAEVLLRQRRTASLSHDPQLEQMVRELATLKADAAGRELAGEVSGELLGDIELLEWEVASRVSLDTMAESA